MSGETVLLSYSIFGVLAVTAFAIFLIKSEHEAMKEDEQDQLPSLFIYDFKSLRKNDHLKISVRFFKMR